jgi:asparagine synthase (glutamine-hydrolysing)
MFYIAVVWNPHDEQCSHIAKRMTHRLRFGATRWQTAIDETGLHVAFTPSGPADFHRVYKLPDGGGVVIGRLFERGPARLHTRHEQPLVSLPLDSAASEQALKSEGRSLFEQFWGAYVAFLHHSASGERWILRDPGGEIPCQRASFEGVDVYFVRVEDLEQVAPVRLTINKAVLFGYLLHSSRSGRETCISEIDTVPPGTCTAYQAGRRAERFYWNPISIASDVIREPFTVVARHLEETTTSAIHAWASCFDHILLSLSGGLDSSIVAGCLTDAPSRPLVTCRNYYADGPSSDERRFAKAVANRCGFRLIEEKIDTRFSASTRVEERSLFPLMWPVDVSNEDADRALKRSLGISVTFNGHGGDELFSRLSTFPSAVDYSWLHGVDRTLLRLMLDDAAALSSSYWRVLRFVYRFGIRKARWNPAELRRDARPLLNDEMKRDLGRDTRSWHPLFAGNTQELPPGKREQAHLIASMTGAFHVPLACEPIAANLSPLLSQPVMELCLRAPMYLHRAHGHDRALARAAFEERLPEEVARRRSKAFGNSDVREVITRSLPQMREALLNGFLAQEGFMDRSKVEAILSGSIHSIPAEVVELCDLMAAEIWAAGWTARGAKRAA